ncbi:uncharacterized protein LOC103310887 [Acyrthosiphon pisum]|uniref:Uncharacterized protein n=1 Tax=Acyrthosiphon pisum TaxID=7029 RepID=A0A8R2FD69_ACYPI|nr:uncharacterized protein LOC103310887 [Acyrthosiphon pisum]|eukprot:XP_008188565.1 PREDICTED: uncharacterized protein LOC103310887 [Acyrthosiphon pisum]
MNIFTVAVITVAIVVAETVPIGGAADPGFDLDIIMEEMTMQGRCPPNVTANFDVMFNDDNSSLVMGCASLEFLTTHEKSEINVFSLKFGRYKNGVCVPGGYGDVDNLVFFCITQLATPLGKYENRKVYKLYGHVIEPVEVYSTRCIMFKTRNSMMHKVAIGGTSSCNGLQGMLSYPGEKPPKGSMLLRSNIPRNNIRYLRALVEHKNSTQLNFSGSRYYWKAG